MDFFQTINGQPVSASASRDIFNPANGALVGAAPIGVQDDLENAVRAAKEAQREWRLSSEDDRKNACARIAAAIEASADELAALLTREQGKPLKGLGAEFEIGGCIAWANAAASMEIPVKVLQDDEASHIEQHRTPLGVVGSITPWNWPLMIAIWHLAPAIRTGNAVVVKPSPYTPLGTLKMVEIIAGELPPGLVNCISGDDDLGAAMTAHEDIQKIMFTGSTKTGKDIMAAAAPTLKRLTLELGGNDPGIVLPDADPATIAEGVFWGAMINSGQTCAALKRLYVHEDIYDAMCEALVAFARATPMGDGMDPATALGPLQNRAQLEKAHALVMDAERNGAKVMSGGAPTGEGFFFPVTIVGDARDGMRLVDEEQFATVLPVIRYKSIDDAIESANRLKTGLAASVWSSDVDAARDIAAKIDAGTVYINKHGEVLPHVPFGGVKESGVGVEFGEEGLEAYTNIKIINIAK